MRTRTAKAVVVTILAAAFAAGCTPPPPDPGPAPPAPGQASNTVPPGANVVPCEDPTAPKPSGGGELTSFCPNLRIVTTRKDHNATSEATQLRHYKPGTTEVVEAAPLVGAPLPVPRSLDGSTWTLTLAPFTGHYWRPVLTDGNSRSWASSKPLSATCQGLSCTFDAYELPADIKQVTIYLADPRLPRGPVLPRPYFWQADPPPGRT